MDQLSNLTWEAQPVEFPGKQPAWQPGQFPQGLKDSWKSSLKGVSRHLWYDPFALHFLAYHVYILQNVKKKLRGWREGSVGKVPATKAWGLEFSLQHPSKSQVCGVQLQSQHRGGGGRRMPGTCWSSGLAKPVSSRFSEWLRLKK